MVLGSELSLVSGNYHENKVSAVMEMASFSLKIRHVFGDTLLTERSIGAGLPVITAQRVKHETKGK
jgi:hypothetical protein